VCPIAARRKSAQNWSPIVKYTVASAINLAILIVGVVIGVMLAPRFTGTTNAQPISSNAQQPPTFTQTVNQGLPMPEVQPKVTPVMPGMTTGTVGIFLILAHHVQSDELVVNGYDILKLQNAELQLLSRFVPQSEIAKAINDSKATELFTVKQPIPQPPAK